MLSFWNSQRLRVRVMVSPRSKKKWSSSLPSVSSPFQFGTSSVTVAAEEEAMSSTAARFMATANLQRMHRPSSAKGATTIRMKLRSTTKLEQDSSTLANTSPSSSLASSSSSSSSSALLFSNEYSWPRRFRRGEGEVGLRVVKREHGGHSHGSLALSNANQTKSELWITWLGLASNLGFGAAKIVTGWVANSSALLADGFHMLGDMTSDMVTLATLKFARRPRSEKHPYGHGRFETVGTLFVSLLLSFTGVGIAYHTIESLVPAALSGGIVEALNQTHTPIAGMETMEGMLAVGVSVVSIVCKEALFQGNMAVARKSGSQVLVANAWHHRTDALTSIMALIGVVGAQMGLPILDPVTGLMVAGLIVKTGASMTMESFRELTDEAIQPELIKEVEELVRRVDGVQSVHNVRARKMGTYSLVDLHIQVDPKLSVSAAHNVAERTRIAILLALPSVSEVLVHVDAEHDHPDPATILAANRHKLKLLPSTSQSSSTTPTPTPTSSTSPTSSTPPSSSSLLSSTAASTPTEQHTSHDEHDHHDHDHDHHHHHEHDHHHHDHDHHPHQQQHHHLSGRQSHSHPEGSSASEPLSSSSRLKLKNSEVEVEGLVLPGRLMLSQTQVEKEVRSALEKLNAELVESGSTKTMKGVSEITCHYLGQQLNVELCVEVDPELKVKDAQHLARLARSALEALSSIDKAHINLRLDDRYPCERLSSSLPPISPTTRKS